MKDTLARLRSLGLSGLEAARAGWIVLRDSWTRKDWMAGIEPLPPGMASHLTAIGMVAGLMITSLVYGDSYQREAFAARLIPSRELPSQLDALPPEPVDPAEPEAEAVPFPASPPVAGLRLPQQGEAFVERFDRVDLTDRWVIADGWSNGEWMTNDWQRSSVDARPNLLTLKLQKSAKGSKFALQGGELQTHIRHRYGYFEVRMKVPRGAGIVTGFFTYAGQQGGVRPNEIDIEILGRNTRVAELTIHQGGKPTSTKITLPFDSADGFHTYGFDWQPGHVRWYADGKLIHEETGEAARKLTRPQQLMLNLWGSEQLHAWVGRLDINRAPWRLEVECMAYQPVYAGPVCG